MTPPVSRSVYCPLFFLGPKEARVQLTPIKQDVAVDEQTNRRTDEQSVNRVFSTSVIQRTLEIQTGNEIELTASQDDVYNGMELRNIHVDKTSTPQLLSMPEDRTADARKNARKKTGMVKKTDPLIHGPTIRQSDSAVIATSRYFQQMRYHISPSESSPS